VGRRAGLEFGEKKNRTKGGGLSMCKERYLSIKTRISLPITRFAFLSPLLKTAEKIERILIVTRPTKKHRKFHMIGPKNIEKIQRRASEKMLIKFTA
jgi:hypothetical protein